MIITISGAAGSGKSTVSKMIAKELGWPRYDNGELRRQKAKERGMTLAEYNKLGETDPSTDNEVDENQKEMGKTQDNFIIEGRASWHFIPHSFKIYIDVDEEVAAERVFGDLQKNNNRNEGKALNNQSDVLVSMRERKESDAKRYIKYYNIDVNNLDNYDYVLNSTDLSINEVFDAVIKVIRENIDKN